MRAANGAVSDMTDGRSWPKDYGDRTYQLTFPDSEVLTYAYAANGLLQSIASSLGPTYLSSADYNALNLPKKYVLGGGGGSPSAEVRHTYNWLDGGPEAAPFAALRTIQFQRGTNALLVNHSISHDPHGNLTGLTLIKDGAGNTETASFSYDDLDRLTAASGAFSESYAYNATGNITSRNSLSFTYPSTGSAHPHAALSYNGASFRDDANGCMTSRGGSWNQTIKYDPERRPVHVDSAGATKVRFAHSRSGARLKRLDAKGTIHYPRSFYERNVGNGTAILSETITKHYNANLGRMRRLLAVRKGGTLTYVGTDHLGSTIRVTDTNFSPVDLMR